MPIRWHACHRMFPIHLINSASLVWQLVRSVRPYCLHGNKAPIWFAAFRCSLSTLLHQNSLSPSLSFSSSSLILPRLTSMPSILASSFPPYHLVSLQSLNSDLADSNLRSPLFFSCFNRLWAKGPAAALLLITSGLAWLRFLAETWFGFVGCGFLLNYLLVVFPGTFILLVLVPAWSVVVCPWRG